MAVINQIQGSFTEWGRLGTVELLDLTCLNRLLFILKILFTLLTKQASLMRRSNVWSFTPRLVFPGKSYKNFFDIIHTLN